MGIIVTIIIFLIIGFATSSADEETSRNNINEIRENLQNENFEFSKVYNFNGYSIKYEFNVDMQNKKIAICQSFPYKSTDIINFSDILECEIIEDSNTIMKGGVGRAIVGGAIAGGVGAIVGANTRASKNVINNLQIRIITKDLRKSLYTITLIKEETKKDSNKYRQAMNFANQVYATLTAIINENTNSNNVIKEENKKYSENTIEELEKLSKLKNDEIITKEEFENLKKQVLNNNTNINNTNINNTSNLSNGKDILKNNINDIYNIGEKVKLYGTNNKVKIIGVLIEETGMGLKEAKDVVDEYLRNME